VEVIIGYAIAMGWRKGPNPALWRGGLKALLPGPSKVHTVERYPALDWREAPALMAALRERETGTGELALAFLILTACRNVEVRGATWSEIDLEQRAWTIPARRMKAGKMPTALPVTCASAASAISAALPVSAHQSRNDGRAEHAVELGGDHHVARFERGGLAPETPRSTKVLVTVGPCDGRRSKKKMKRLSSLGSGSMDSATSGLSRFVGHLLGYLQESGSNKW
jgi:integrase